MTFFDKLKFLGTAVGNAVWPFLKQFLIAESKVLLTSARMAVLKVARDEDGSLKGTGWQGKTAAAVGYVLADMATKGVDVAEDIILDYVRVAYKDWAESKD